MLFGPFEWDSESLELRRAGVPVRIQKQPLQLLAVLMERSGRVVTRQELQKRLWPGDTFVDFEDGLNTAIKKLREALGDDREHPQFIETVPRHGYRFITQVEIVDVAHPSGDRTAASPLLAPRGEARDAAVSVTETSGDPSYVAQPAREPASIPALSRRSRSWRLAVAFPAVALLICAAVAYGWWRFHQHMTAAAEAPIRSIAVLPFDNFSGDPNQDYFADGMTDELITDLAQLSSLRVTSRSSVMQYKGARKPMEQIRQELHVDAVVEGSVVRSGNTVRVDAQLIETSDDRHLWAQSFTHDEEDIVALQDDVAQAVAERVETAVEFSWPRRLANGQPVSAEAYEAYLHGIANLQHHSDADLLKSLDYFKRAVAVDPAFAPGYAGMAQTYCLLGDYSVLPDRVVWPQAEMSAQRALALDDSISRAHAALASALWRYEWDWKGADAQFQRALVLSPNDSDTRHLYALFLAAKGDFARAEQQLKEAEKLDPLSLIIRTNIGWLSYYQHDFPKATAAYQDVLRTNPLFLPAHAKLWIASALQGKNEQAARELETVFKLYGHSGLLKLAERRDPGAKFRDIFQAYIDSGYMSVYEKARLLSVSGQNEQALQTLRKAEADRNSWMIYLGIEPAFDPLRSSPQFQRLLKDIGLSNPTTPGSPLDHSFEAAPQPEQKAEPARYASK
jgi:TolB-like protein/DNA-binding winged helix-turn-helix (wHTH) protein